MSLVGTIFEGYKIEELLSTTSVAEIYLGYEKNLIGEQPYAIKVLSLEASQDTAYVTRFMREMNALSAVQHPNIVALKNWGMGEGERLYSVTPYLGGLVTLAQAVQHYPFSPARMQIVLRSILDALAYIHDTGAVHRNVNPSSILIKNLKDETKWHIYLGDFVLVKTPGVDSNVTDTVNSLGDARYVSPELTQDPDSIDHRSDLYAVGILLYEVLLGQMPYTYKNDMTLVVAHNAQPPMLPTALAPDFPPEIEAVLMTALAKDRNKRYSSAYDFWVAYEQAVAAAGDAALVSYHDQM